MPNRKLIVQIVGDDDSLRRAFKRSATGAAVFDRNLSRATRGALAGSGVFRGLGRSIAFASGGFLAFASAGQFLRSSIDAAKEAAVTQKQLGAQFKASGQNLSVYQGEIDKTANRLSLLAGFQNDEVKSSFVTIFRASGDVKKSLRDVGLAADIARARHIDLSKAATIVAKVEAGNIGILRRAGVQIGKNATVEEALAIARAKFAGQARAGTTAQERFGAVLHNTEEIIGTALLPILNKYLNSGAKWLTQMNESGRLQRDVASATQTVGDVFHAVEAVVRPLAQGFRLLGKATGGTKNAVELLGTAFLVLKVRARLAALGLFEVAAAETAVGTSAVVGRVGAYTGAVSTLGDESSVAAGRVSLLAGALRRLGALGLVTVGVEIVVHRKGFAKAIGDAVKDATGSGFLGDLTKKFERIAIDVANPGVGGFDIAQRIFGGKKKPSGTSQTGRQGLNREIREHVRQANAAADAAITKANRSRKGLSLQGRFNLADFALQKAALTERTSDDRKALVLEAQITREQLAQSKSLKDKTRFTQQLAGILSQIRGIDEADAQSAKDAALAQKERAKAAREHTAAVLQQRQFRVLGLDAQGQAFTPNVRSLRKELGSVSDAVKGTFLDTGKTQSVLAKIRRLLTGHFGALSKDVRATVKQMLDDVQQQLRDRKVGPETTFQKFDLSKLVAGIPLSAADKKALEARLSQVSAGGTVPRGSAGSPSASSGDVHETHLHLSIDGREIEPTVTRRQEKRRRRNPGQRRGPHAGI